LVDTLKATGFMSLLAGVLAGMVLATEGSKDFDFVIALPFIVSGILSCLLFVALGAILEKVNDLHAKLAPPTPIAVGETLPAESQSDISIEK